MWKPIKITVGGKEKKVGELNEELKTFRTKKQKSKHFMRAFKAWGIDARIWNDIIAPNGFNIEIHETDMGDVYAITTEKAKSVIQYKQFGNNGLQIFIAEEHFNRTRS